MSSDYPHLETVARQLVLILAPRRGYKFDREIHVEDNCGGDVDVSLHRVIIHPFFLTEGDPIACMEHVIDVCMAFDKRYKERTARAIIDLKHRLRWCISELKRLDPEALQSIIEEELGFGEDKILRLRA